MHEFISDTRILFWSGPLAAARRRWRWNICTTCCAQADRGESILVIAPQRSLLKPYQAVLRRADLPPAARVETLTIGGLAKRSVDLMWPAMAREAGFAQPDRPPTFLTLETAQYYMERVVQPFITERYYFEERARAQ